MSPQPFEVNFQSLFEDSPLSITLLNSNGEIVECNSITKEIFGIERDLILYKHFTELFIVPDENNQEIKKIFKEVLAGRKYGPNDIQILTQKGEKIWVNIVASLIQVGDNQLIQVLTQDINQRKLLERTIEESERRYKGLYDSSPIALTVTDSNGVILDINSATEKIFGFKKSEVIGEEYFKLGIYSHEQVERFKKDYQESLKGKKISPIEIQIKRKDGTIAWLNIQNSLKKIGNEFLIEGITQDITERKIAEQKLIESKEKYRNLADSLPEVIFEIDLSYNITYTNSIASKVFGYSNEEFKKGMNISQFLTFDDTELVLKQTQQIFEGEYVKPLVLKLKRKDGTTFFAEIHASRIFKENSVSGVRCIIHDITDLKNSQKKIKESEEKYRLLSENAKDLITVVDNHFKIDYINEKAHERLMGYSSEDLMGKNSLDLIHPEDRELVIKALKEKYNSIEVRIRRKNGRYVWMDTSAEYYKDQDGKNYILTISRDITERKEGAQKLIESQKKYKDLANSLPEVIFEIDLNFKLTYTNAIASQIFGYSHEDFKKGLNVFNFISPGEKELVLENLSRIFKGELIEPFILQLRKKDDSFFYGTINATPIFRGSKIVGMRSIIHDVTEMVNAEEKIKESETKFRTISEQSLMGISIIQDDRVKYVNKTLSDILGYSTEEVLSWSPGEFFKTIHPKDKKRVIELATKIGDHFDNGVNYYEARGIHKNGNIIWLELYSKVIRFQKHPAFLVLYIDISERKKAKEELRKSEEKYKFLFEKSPSSILLIDTSGKIEDCNPALEKLIEYDRTELIGNRFGDLSFIHPQYLPHLLIRLKQISDGEKLPPIDIQLIKKDGSVIWVNYNSSLVKMGNKTYILVMGHDISAKKEAEEKLKELNEMRREFLDRASHELKTPITTVYGAYQLLTNLYMDKFEGEVLELLEMAFSGTLRLKKLVDDLLDVSKIESRMLKLEKTETNLSELINDCVTELNYLIKKRDQKIELNIPNELIINVDRLRIELVLTNLLTNSIKYTPIKGKIFIKLEKIEDYAELKIKDTGIGLTKSEIEKLFKKFTKIENPYDDKVDINLGSTGLGLHITKSIVELHSGTITAQSAGKNKGSTFIVRLPFMNN